MSVTASTRADRGPDRLSVGITLWLASELMFFAGLFAAYFTLRAATNPWPPAGVDLATGRAAIATVLLVLSSGTLRQGERAIESDDVRTGRRWFLVTLLLGALFIGLQALEYFQLDFSVSSHTYGSIFYLLTGFHGIHVLAGLFLIALSTAMLVPQPNRGFMRGVGLYWHFVDAVWIGLFATIYLLP
jgi:cytochrome c oxidase subunit III